MKIYSWTRNDAILMFPKISNSSHLDNKWLHILVYRMSMPVVGDGHIAWNDQLDIINISDIIETKSLAYFRMGKRLTSLQQWEFRREINSLLCVKILEIRFINGERKKELYSSRFIFIVFFIRSGKCSVQKSWYWRLQFNPKRKYWANEKLLK